jgi:hypothetical protein
MVEDASGRSPRALPAERATLTLMVNTTVEYHPAMDMDKDLENYEKSLGLPAGFINSLKEEGDDWSFTIKAHALVETGLTEIILHSIGKPALDEMLARLPITGQFSKLAICGELKLLPDDGETGRFVSVLGGVRNRLVHNIKRVDFSLNGYFDELHKADAALFEQQRRALDLVFGAKNETVEINGQKMTTPDVFRANARLVIFSSLTMVLARIHFAAGFVKWDKEMRDAGHEYFSKLFVERLLAEHAAAKSFERLQESK